MKILTRERPLTPSFDLILPSVGLLRKYFWQTMYLSFLPALLMSLSTVMLLVGHNTETGDIIWASGDRLLYGIIVLFIAATWSLLTSAGFFYLQVQALKGKDISTLEAFKKGLPRILPLLASTGIATALVVAGLIAFIIPGLILLRAFYLSPYYVVGEKMGPLQALKQSYRDSKPVTWYIYGIIGVKLFFVSLGALWMGIPVLGYLLNLATRYLYEFAPALRYGEIARNIPVRIVDQAERS